MRDKAIALRQSGMKLKDIGSNLGISTAHAQRLCAGVDRSVTTNCGFCGCEITGRADIKFCSIEHKRANQRWRQSFPEYDTYQTYLKGNRIEAYSGVAERHSTPDPVYNFLP
jgi:hypothetical protein